MRRKKFTTKYFAISLSFPVMQTAASSPNFNIYFHIDNHHRHAVSQTSPITAIPN